MESRTKRVKIDEGKSITMDNVYLTFDCGYTINPNIFINHVQGIVSIGTNVKCKDNCNLKSLNINNHVIKNFLQVFSLSSFESYF